MSRNVAYALGRHEGSSRGVVNSNLVLMTPVLAALLVDHPVAKTTSNTRPLLGAAEAHWDPEFRILRSALRNVGARWSDLGEHRTQCDTLMREFQDRGHGRLALGGLEGERGPKSSISSFGHQEGCHKERSPRRGPLVDPS